MIAAGVLLLADDRALFLLRGPDSDNPFTWCLPGGADEAGESAEECAARECEEECGLAPDDLKLLTRSISPVGAEGAMVDFTTFFRRVNEFTPTLCDEHVGYCWAPVANPPGPLHPGCSVALERLSMDELGVARAMSEGRLVSPQRYENVTLWAMRITGTGMSYRDRLNEYVWRDPSEYMHADFLARCNGLAVIWRHPKEKSTLDSKEFADRVVGSIMLPYLRPDLQEVWGIAKVYDDEANTSMENEQLSTSPAVVFKGDVNERLKYEDGTKLLVEGKPALLDHLAICSVGVWDKGGPPTGVDRTGVDVRETIADSAQRLPLLGMLLTAARADLLGRRFDQLARH